MAHKTRFLPLASLAVATSLCLALPLHANTASVKVNFTQNTAAEFLITVDQGNTRYRFVTYVPEFESPTEGIEKQRALSAWKGDYLFVRHQCGQLTNWRCVVDQVFTLKQGKLTHLGAVESRDCTAPGCRYDPATGAFRDILDRFQVNPVTGQTDTPPLPIVRRATAVGLEADRDATWDANKETYKAGLACLQHVTANGFATPCADGQNAWTALMFAAKLTHYTGREAEWKTLFEQYGTGYCARSADQRCQWRVNGAKDFMARIAPGELPTSTPTPVRLTRADIPEPPTLVPEKIDMGKPIKLKL